MECSEDSRRLSTVALLLVQNTLYTWGLEQVAFFFLIWGPNMGPGTLSNTNGPHESGLWNLQRLRACGPAQIWDP
jgi:hypothetical protein